jgi:putative endonuclease
MWYIYFLKSFKKDNWIYVGSTNNLERRIFEHNNKKVKSTKYFVPLSLIYSEGFNTEREARNREQYFKHWDGRIEKKNILKSI